MAKPCLPQACACKRAPKWGCASKVFSLYFRPHILIKLLSLLRHPDHNVVGLYIIDLPVTTVAACAAGAKFGTPEICDAHFLSGAGQAF